MNLQLENKLAFVSGSTAGIGFAIAKANGISPAEVEKEFFNRARPSSRLRRFATPDEVAAQVAFVASPLSSATNGAALRAEGGLVRSIL